MELREFESEVVVDLLVCGGGAAGMTAALVAAEAGLRVMLVEKHHKVGGTTATSGGMVWLPGNGAAARQGRPDDLAAARTYMRAEIGVRAEDELVDAFADSSSVVLADLESRFGLRFEVPYPNPDYHDAPGASLGGRAVVPAPFDGRRLGADFSLLRAPRETLTVLGGMMVARREVAWLLRPFSSWKALRFTAAVLWRHARDRLRYPRGTRLLLGNALAAQLLFALRKRGVEIRTDCALEALESVDGRVIAAVVREGKAVRRVTARRGVVLATGGFAGSESWRARLAPKTPVQLTMAFEESRGEAFDAALRVGAALEDKDDNAIFWVPVSVQRIKAGERLWMHGVLDRAKPGIIAVDNRGKRFTNEADSYHDFVRGMQRAGLDRAHLVCDAAFLKRFGLGLVPPGWPFIARYLRSGYLKRGRTLQALAQECNIDAAGLSRTVRDFNADASAGCDRAFGRGRTALNRHNGDPAQQPNPCVAPITTGPFYAVTVYPAVLGTSAGLRTDVDGCVLDTQGCAIPGLYACGNDMASVMRGAYPGPGITLGPALVFGWRVGRHAADAMRNAPRAVDKMTSPGESAP